MAGWFLRPQVCNTELTIFNVFTRYRYFRRYIGMRKFECVADKIENELMKLKSNSFYLENFVYLYCGVFFFNGFLEFGLKSSMIMLRLRFSKFRSAALMREKVLEQLLSRIKENIAKL
jgi:hypothetical protein